MKQIILILIVFFYFRAEAQEKPASASLKGYVTTMQSVMFESLSDNFINDNLLHNRLNFKVFITSDLTIAAELRNRLFTGDMVKTGPFYADYIGADPGWIDMSWNILSRPSILFNTKADRLWIDYSRDRLQITLGRQRINWGQAIVWNPNDIFNAYSFFDFDYMERPGSDAVRIQYFPSFSSALELAVKTDSHDNITAAGLFRFNKWSYDLQFLAGYAESKDFVAGLGWSGVLGSSSFRGEGSWFIPVNSDSEAKGTLIVTAGIDRILKDNSMVQLQLMYCNNPLELNSFTGLYGSTLSAKDLAFSEFTAFGQFSWAAGPLLNLTLSGMWFPDIDGFFAGPSADFSLAENVDFSFIWQYFNSMLGGERKKMNLGFLKIKYSF
ncbi:MAG TPA: hypothetical protein VK861_04625 [Bacteroidales bacterium]|nr:hypothetical protein [Bacteroidales bacterium]